MTSEQSQNALTPFLSVAMNILIENTSREDFTGSGIDLTQASYVSMTTLV